MLSILLITSISSVYDASEVFKFSFSLPFSSFKLSIVSISFVRWLITFFHVFIMSSSVVSPTGLATSGVEYTDCMIKPRNFSYYILETKKLTLIWAKLEHLIRKYYRSSWLFQVDSNRSFCSLHVQILSLGVLELFF